MKAEALRELAAIVKQNGGGNFAASVFLREDGFLIQFNLLLLERLKAKGTLKVFCELLSAQFQEVLKDAEEKTIGGASGFSGCYVDNLSGLQKQR